MGTAVLRAQDCLNTYHNNRQEGFIGTVYHLPANPNSKSKSPQGSGKNSGHGPGISAQKAKAPPENKRQLKPKVIEYKIEDEVSMETEKTRQNNQRHNGKSNSRHDLLEGRVTILKGGEMVESSSHIVSPPKTAASAKTKGSVGPKPKAAGKKAKSKSREL